ncbi:MAG: acetyl-CoA acetyltransferase [Acidimicrobiales bacterium]
MTLDPRTPVLVGVGQVLAPPDPDTPLEQRAEPAALMTSALEAAAEDAGPGAGRRLLERAGSLRVMATLSWQYANPAALVARQLGIEPAELAVSAIGGNSPMTIAAASAAAIARGEHDVVLLTGAEAIYTRVSARRHPDRPVLPWTAQSPATTAPVLLGSDREPVTDTERGRGLDRPLRVFPLFASALRAAAGRTIDEDRHYVATLWSRFSEVAARNPYAWSRRAYSAEEIATASPDNRMISFPYPKRMNANDRVDMGAALVLCSIEAARDAGVADEMMVFPIAASDAHDHWFLSHRQNLHSSPAIRHASRAVFGYAGVGVDDVAHVDLYSCFPCAVQIAAQEIGLPLDDPSRALTVTGGLAFAGGPGNNYVSHSIATMAGRLRGNPGTTGLVTGLGWYATKHAVGLWSADPPATPFAHVDVQPEVDALPQRAPGNAVEGAVTVEAYTVVHDRDGTAELGIVALLDDDGSRAWGNVADADTMSALMAEECVGRKARLHAEGRLDLYG